MTVCEVCEFPEAQVRSGSRLTSYRPHDLPLLSLDDTRSNCVRSAGTKESMGGNPQTTFLAPTSFNHSDCTGSFPSSLTQYPEFLSSLQRDLKEIAGTEEGVGVDILDP